MDTEHEPTGAHHPSELESLASELKALAHTLENLSTALSELLDVFRQPEVRLQMTLEMQSLCRAEQEAARWN